MRWARTAFERCVGGEGRRSDRYVRARVCGRAMCVAKPRAVRIVVSVSKSTRRWREYVPSVGRKVDGSELGSEVESGLTVQRGEDRDVR